MDSAELATISEKLGASASTLASEIYEIAGEEFNVNSTQQLRKIIFEKLKIHEELGVTKIKDQIRLLHRSICPRKTI